MHPAVRASFLTFTQPLEGRVPYMYLDILGLVTTGVGNLIDPSSEAVKLPWTIGPNGEPASREAIRADWDALKNRQDLRRLHHKYAAPITRCRLSEAAIDALVLGKLAANVAHMTTKHFPGFAGWPADAQIGACSMAWACGPGFPATFKNFARAANAGDWLAAAAACAIRDGLNTPQLEDDNLGIVPRNKANRLCFTNAAAVVAAGAPLDVLHWPAAFDAAAWAVEADTEPAVPHPGPAPVALAEPFSVAEAVVRDGLRDMSGED